jgi:cysteine desulfurase family protein (TIGR01976 family)
MTEFKVDQVREMFPALVSKDEQQATVFLDNPGGTQVPGTVIEAIGQAMTSAASNLGGLFPDSIRAEEIWQSSHEAMADMVGASSMREIIVGPSMTSLTLHISRSLGRTFNRGDEIIVTRMDHEGDISPWLWLAEDLGLVVKWLSFNRDSWQIEVEDLKPLLTDKTRLLALNFASNLTGSINNVAQLSSVARAAGALVYVDAVQLAPHRLVSVNELGCDFLACSSYKFYGPHLGILWGRESILEKLHAYRVRCSSDELPQKFETGTPQTELLAGLEATVDYFQWVGELCGYSGSRREKLAGAYAATIAYEDQLTTQLIQGLQEIRGLEIFGITDFERIQDRVPTISFIHDRVTPGEMSRSLAQHGICAWTGHNYAYEVAKHLGLDVEQGVLRLGIAQYNTESEIDKTLGVLTELLK